MTTDQERCHWDDELLGHMPVIRQAINTARRHADGQPLWFHGNDSIQPFQEDKTHPGIWLADRLSAALWYTINP